MTKNAINKKAPHKTTKTNKDITYVPRSIRYIDNGRTISPASPHQLYNPPSVYNPPTVLPLKIDIHAANNNKELKHNIEAEMINKEKDAKSIAEYNKRIASGTALDPQGFWDSDGNFKYFDKVPVLDQKYNPYQALDEYPDDLIWAGKNRKTKRRKSLKKKQRKSKKKTKTKKYRKKSMKKKQRKTKRRSHK
jgi:hypothetical protein